MTSGKTHILYVDDEQILLDLGKVFLEKKGEFTVNTLTSAQKALSLLKAHPVDVIISDYQMPDMDGIEFLKAVRARGDKTPFIIFTGKGREEVVIEALNSGADFYLQKGGEPQAQFTELTHKIKKAVESRRAAVALSDSQKRTAEIIEFLPDATFAINREGVVIAWNHAMEVMTGVKKSKILNKGNYEYSIPFYRERRPLLIDLVLGYDETVAEKYPGITRDGDKFVAEIFIPHFNDGRGAHLWFTASPLYDAAGNLTGGIESIREITTRKQAEQGFRKARDEYVNLLEHMNDVYYRSDNQGNLILASSSWAKYLGYDNLSLCLGKNIAESFYADPDKRKRFLDEVYRKGSVSDYEVTLKKKDGTPLSVATSSYLYFDDAKNVLGIEGTWRDITDRKQVEKALVESEERFREQYRNNPLAIFTWKHREGDFILVDCNNAAKAITSGRAYDFIGKTASEMYATRPEIIFDIRQAFSERRGLSKELISEHFLPGRLVNTIATYVPPDLIMVHMEDITDRRQVEGALRENQARLDLALRSAEMGVWYWDIIKNTRYFDAQTCHLLGIDPATFTGSAEEFFAVVHPDDREKLKEALARTIEHDMLYEPSYRAIWSDGSIHYITARGRVVRDAEGNPERINGIVWDITEHKRVEEALRESEDMHRLVLEFAGISSTLWTTDGHLLMINRYGAANLGSVPKDFSGKTMADMFGPEAAVGYLERIRQAAATGTRLEFEDHVPLPEGDRWFLSAHTRITDSLGQVKGVMIFSLDITKRKIAELAHRDSTDQLAFAIEGAHLGLWDINFTNRTISHNRYWNDMLGYGTEDTTQPIEWWRKSLHPDDLPVIDTASSDHQNGKTPVLDIVYRIRHRDGRWLWIHTIGRVVSRSADGKPLRMSGINQDITDRKRTEKELRESRDRLNFAIQGAHLGTWDLDRSKGTITHNVRWNEMLGYAGEETTTKADWWLGQIHPDDVSSVQDMSQAHVTGKTPVLDMTYRMKKADGTWVWVQTIGRAIERDKKGIALRMSGINQDVTELKQAGKAILEREEKFREIFNKANDAIHLHEIGEDGHPGKFIDVNDVACQMLQYSRDEMLQHGPLDFATQYHSRPVDTILEELRTVGHATFETGHRRKDGTIVPVEVNAHKITLLGRTVVLSVVRDITERKQVEATLRMNEERLNLAIESAHFGLWDLNIVTNDVVHNRRWTEMLGFSTNEMEKPSDWWGERVYPDDYPLVEKSSLDHYSGKAPLFDVVYRMKHKDGSWRWVHTQGKVVARDTDGRPLRMIGINQDITERKLAEDTVRKSKEFLNKIINTIGDPIYVKDREHRLVLVNDAACALFGCPREEMLGLTGYDLFPTREMADRSFNRDEEVFLTGKDSISEETNTYAPGKTRTVLVRKSRYEDEYGEQFVVGISVDITERKRIEEVFRESEHRLADIISFLPDATLVIDKNGTVVAWNRAMEEMTGVAAEQMIGKADYEYALPFYHERRPITADLVLHDDPAVAAKYPVMKTEGKSRFSEIFIPHLNGGKGAYLWFTATPLYDAHGNITGAIESIRDITGRKRADEEIRTLQQFQQSIIDNAKVWISVLDPKGTILVWNNAAEEISGYPADDVIGKNTVWKQLYPDPVYRKQVVENILDIIKKNTFVENFETRIRTKSGDEKIIWWNTQPLRDESGKAVQFIAIGRDNTERRQAEERIKVLRQFEESVIKNANIWISVLDGKGNVSVWNKAAEEISGYNAREVIGKNTIWSRMYPDKDYRRTVTATIKEIIGAHKYLENFETRIRTKDGLERIIWWNTRVLQDVPGIDETFIAIGKDVTEQKTLSDALRQANKQLNLLSSITRHDILNQLMALRGYIELSRDYLDDKKTLVNFLEKEETAARTIEEQIMFTRDYQELGVVAPVWQNVNAGIQKAVTGLLMRDVRAEVDRSDLEIFVDPLFEKVFYNLIDNALRYGGSDLKTIRVSSQESDTSLEIVCEDDGVGITDEDKKKLFRKGFGKHTGLGLFLSREILAITGITITENGIPGKGARFEITVPKGAYRFNASSTPAEGNK